VIVVGDIIGQVAPKRLASELIRSQIGVMVNDLVAETRTRIAESDPMRRIRRRQLARVMIKVGVHEALQIALLHPHRIRFPEVAPKRLASELIRSQIGVMVNDLVAETRTRIAASWRG
jgi:ribosome biogenesis SPOUT family RNA methylase Rps3